MYFTGVSRENLKKEYRRLAMKMHPDRGGDTKKFQDMKREYETLEAGGTYSDGASSSSSRNNQGDYFKYRYHKWDGSFEDYFGEGYPSEDSIRRAMWRAEQAARQQEAAREEAEKRSAKKIKIYISPVHARRKSFHWKDKNGNVS